MYKHNHKKADYLGRRDFLKFSIAAAASAAIIGSANSETVPAKSASRPNVLVIMTDQQSADTMSCVIGSKYLSTPHMDSLAASGVRFSRAYSPNPLCTPMRTSMITGRYPHQTRVETNIWWNPEIESHLCTFPFMGKTFKDAGFETAYFGKWHIPMNPAKYKQVHGFDIMRVDNSESVNPQLVAQFIKQKHDRPFMAVASFVSPHEVCEWSRRQRIPGDQLGPVPLLDALPPMRTNSQPPTGEADIITYMRKSYHALPAFPVGNYTDYDWRRLIWGYYRLVERADAYVGTVLQALRDSGLENNTVIVFLSDHGECQGAHGWNQKTVFYDESVRVPFIISFKGAISPGTCDVLLNTGIDLLPTLCDFTGISVPCGLPGKSLKPHALGQVPAWSRNYIVSQNYFAQGVALEDKILKPRGRMVRSDRFKYCLYDHGDHRESIVDMAADPGEMTNLASDPQFKVALKEHRAYLKEYAETQKDRTALNMLSALPNNVVPVGM